MKLISNACKSIFSRGVRGFYALFLAPKSVNEDNRRREYILNVILVGSMAMLAFFELLVLYYSLNEGSRYNEVPVPIFSAILIFFVFLFILSRRGWFTLVSYLLVLGYLASDGYAAYVWGIDLHIVVLSYALIVLMASTLIGTWFGFVVAGIIAALIIPLRYFQIAGMIPLHSRTDAVVDAVALAVVIFLIMILAWLWNHEVGKSLSRARKSESALKEERDMLEVRVEERTEALKRAQFEKMEQMNQFAEFGHLASGLFHDLLNLVNAASLVDEAKLPAQTSTIGQRVDGFMQAIRRQLHNQETHELFSLAEGVEYVLQLLSYKAMKENIRISFSRKGDRELVYFGDTFKFHQIVMNLILNAIDAYKDFTEDSNGRSIEIRLEQSGEFVVLTVSDHGRGIPEAVRAKIFEPFFTLKQGGRGMGIGLASVKKFVENDFHGTVFIESEEGYGARFIVRFPAKIG